MPAPKVADMEDTKSTETTEPAGVVGRALQEAIGIAVMAPRLVRERRSGSRTRLATTRRTNAPRIDSWVKGHVA